jgi:two-component system cell cycle sensor histidine kinase/response regulator CckA
VEDGRAIRAFWEFYEPRRTHVRRRIRESDDDLSCWRVVLEVVAPLLTTWSPNLELQRAAIIEDRWQPYLAALQAETARCARLGVLYAGWFDVLRAYRNAVHDELAGEPHRDAELVRHGLNLFLDIATATVALAFDEERHRTMFEHCPLPMWMYDRETLAFLAVNDAALEQYGYTEREFLGMTLSDIRPEEDLAALRAHVRAGGRELRPWRHRKRDGTTLLVEVHASDFVLEGRNVRLVLIADVTEREESRRALAATEAKLRHSQKLEAIGRLAGGVAHDFNNLLTVISSYATLLCDRFHAGDEPHADAAEIRIAAERATAITRQLLTLSSCRSIEARAIELNDVISQLLPMLRRLVGDNVTITAYLDERSTIVADRSQVDQVLLNLAVNARDAMSDGGRITLETRTHDLDDESAALRGLRPGLYVVLSVTDTGMGMDADTQARIFEPFFTTKESAKGTGLGLSIVHGIVAQAGGTIAVYSEPGQGTAFHLYLPACSDAVAAEPPAVTVSDPLAIEPATVLLVDDDHQVRAVSARILRAAGCSVLEAATADEATHLGVTYEGPIDVLFTDVILADGRGDELARRLSALRPGLEIVLTSGYPAGALTVAGEPRRPLVAKPFSPLELRSAIARALAERDPSAAPRPETARPRVLLVDDDEDVRRSLTRFLTVSGFDVTEARCGRDAMAMLGADRFDVVLSDVVMPDGTGLDVLRAARRVDLDVPIILTTGMPDLRSATEALEYGAFRYLAKPIDLETYEKAVRHAVRVHALARLRRSALAASGSNARSAIDRAGLEVRLEAALERLWMAFQPIVDARTAAPFGVEALMRSDEPSMASPPAILSAATELGCLARLGRLIRARAASAFAPHRDRLTLFVNLHPDELDDNELVAPDSPLSAIAGHVVLEVTERAALRSSPDLVARLARLREMGYRLAVDDIGAGYSGLTSFTDLMPEIVKIDMSLVREVHLSALKQRTIQSISSLCHDVGTLVVAEGIETPLERECLATLGCDLLQGYLFGRPTRDI